jgi:Flp pilus assembly protein TadD
MAATLAAAYAEAGRFAEAITTARRALQLATGQNNATLAAALEAELKLYQAGIPFHDNSPSR